MAFGIESGLFAALGTQTGFLEACICAIFDGNNYYTGMSCGFEVPSEVLALIFNKKITLSEACHQSGFSKNPNLGSGEGMIGCLTNGRINRKEYTKQSIITALLQLENPSWYKKPTSCEAPSIF